MANRSTKKSLERFKYEVADELGVPLSNGYNGDLTANRMDLSAVIWSKK